VTALVLLGGLVAVGLAAYYVRIHFVWRAEVRRRRAERERERAQRGYGRMYSLVPNGSVDVLDADGEGAA
jgi:hypothetical protein